LEDAALSADTPKEVRFTRTGVVHSADTRKACNNRRSSSHRKQRTTDYATMRVQIPLDSCQRGTRLEASQACRGLERALEERGWSKGVIVSAAREEDRKAKTLDVLCLSANLDEVSDVSKLARDFDELIQHLQLEGDAIRYRAPVPVAENASPRVATARRAQALRAAGAFGR
jgi:hypothetical protein